MEQIHELIRRYLLYISLLGSFGLFFGFQRIEYYFVQLPGNFFTVLFNRR